MKERVPKENVVHGTLNGYRRGCRCEDCLAKTREYHRAYRAKNREYVRIKARQRMAKWRKDNHEKWLISAREHCRHWRENNRQKFNEVMRAANQNRRLREKGAKGEATRDQINARIAYYGWRCWICSQPYQAIDHVKPVSKGGSGWPSNLRSICNPCNQSKRDKWPFVVTREIIKGVV